MNLFLRRLGEAWGRLGTGQRIQLAAALVATLGLVWGFTAFANRVRYGVLFSNLERKDASTIMSELKEKRVPYRLSAGGTVVEVPFEQIDELRLELASSGLPPGGGVGFEIFDKPAFGLSDFVQNVNFRRALERELERTIQSLDAVDSARVHLALPPESAFAEDRRDPSASVVVRLRTGRSLAKEKMRAITHLVASGVEGLDASQVSVINSEGELLTGGDSEDLRLTASQYEAKLERERDIERTLIAILEPVIGRGRVRASATVELNHTRVERREESFDPDVSVIRSQEKKKTKSQDAAGAAGVPGAAANLPGAAAAPATDGTSSQESQESLTNFELNKTVSTTLEGAGNLLRQSVAVVVDHAAPAPAADDGSGDAAADGAPVPRTQEEMTKITELVRAAIGFNANRGDVLTVENVPFERVTPLSESPGIDITGLLVKISRFASLPIAVLLMALFVIRPGITALRSVAQPQPGAELPGVPPTVAQLQAQMQGQLGPGEPIAALGAGSSPLRDKLVEAISTDPRTAALVVRTWMNDKPGQSS